MARANPDGYTFIVVAPNTHIFPQLINKKMPYDPVKDFAPLSLMAVSPYLLVTNPAFPAKTAAEFVALVRGAPGRQRPRLIGHAFLALTSDAAELTVLVPPAIVASPANRTNLAGGTVSFTVTASGSARASSACRK